MRPSRAHVLHLVTLAALPPPPAPSPCPLPLPAAAPANYTLKRSKGFEGMAASPDKKYLYPMLEGPLYDVVGKFYENVTNPDTGKLTDVLRIWKFNVETKLFEASAVQRQRAQLPALAPACKSRSRGFAAVCRHAAVSARRCISRQVAVIDRRTGLFAWHEHAARQPARQQAQPWKAV